MKSLFFLLALAGLLHAALPDQAGTGYLLDDIPKSVRSMAMGNVIAAPGNCANSGNYEPGLVPGSEKISFMSFHAALPFGDQLFCLGGGFDFRERLGVRLFWSQVSSRNIEKTEIDSLTAADTFAYHVVGSMDEYENLFSCMAGYSFFPGFNAGFAIKYYYNILETITAGGMGADAGLSWQGLPANFGIGLLVRNLIRPSIRFNQGLGAERLPQSIRFGVSYLPIPSALNVFADAVQTLKSGYIPEYSLGLEFRPVPVLALRAGYGEFNLKKNGAVCLGAGLFVKGVYFDYAFNGRPDLGFAGGHRLGIGYRLDDE